jgi:DNA-binding NarL/FixJ family response regulator
MAMPELNGIEASRQVTAECPETKVIALSMHSSRRFVLGMLRAGAVGYLLKDAAFQELSFALSAVQADQVYLSPSIASVVVEKISDPSGYETAMALPLTPREREVLQLLAEGKRTSEISNLL